MSLVCVCRGGLRAGGGSADCDPCPLIASLAGLSRQRWQGALAVGEIASLPPDGLDQTLA